MIQNLSLDTIISILKLSQKNSEALFELFTENQDDVCDFYKGNFNHSAGKVSNFFYGALWNNDAPTSSIVLTLNSFD
jgi:hypothetical protein